LTQEPLLYRTTIPLSREEKKALCTFYPSLAQEGEKIKRKKKNGTRKKDKKGAGKNL